LFNKDAVIEWLIQPEQQGVFGDGEEVMNLSGVAEAILGAADVGHGEKKSAGNGRDGGIKVKALKDLVEVKFEKEVEVAAVAVAGGDEKRGIERWVCPVSRKELGPGSRGCYLVPCGHAFAESAVREIKEEVCLVVCLFLSLLPSVRLFYPFYRIYHNIGLLICLDYILQCSTPFETSNIITINSTFPTDIQRLHERIISLTASNLSHSLKSLSKKRKKDSGNSKDKSTTTPTSSSQDMPPASKKASMNKNSVVVDVAKELEKKRLANGTSMSDNVKSLFTSSDRGVRSSKGNRDFMTRGFTMPVEKR